jgi:hypothetical protein
MYKSLRLNCVILSFVSLTAVMVSLGGCGNLLPERGKSSQKNQAVPAWVLSAPLDSREWFWGVGEGPELDTAKRAALKDIAAKLRVSISGQLESQVTVDNNKVDRQARTRISEEVQKTEFSNYVVDKTAQAANGFYVLVKVDRQAFIRDLKSKLNDLDARMQPVKLGLDKQSPLERFMALRRLQPALEQGVGYAQLLIGAEPGGEGAVRLRNYQAMQEQVKQAPTQLVFALQNKPEDADLADAVGGYLNEMGIRTQRGQSGQREQDGGNVLSISSQSRMDQIYGSKMVKLQVLLSVRDDAGRALAGREYAVSGSSTYDFAGARQSAIQKLLASLRAAGPAASLGFAD